MGVEEWFTLERAAKHLGVSSRTLRRWIKSGKIQARLEPGPYGQQYVVPRSTLQGVHLVRDIEREAQQAEREGIPRAVDAYLSERESALGQEIASLRAELHDAVERIEHRQQVLGNLIQEILDILRSVSASQGNLERSDEAEP